MKKSFTKRIIASALGAVMLFSAVPVSAANVEETPGIQLQTILIDNNGNNWTTKSWGGDTMTPNTNWTALSISDYYENGYLNFEALNNGTGEVSFRIGLVSHNHGKETRIFWNDLEEYSDISVGTEWTSYSLPIKPLVDANKDTDFTLEYFYFVAVSGVPKDTTVSFRNVTVTSPDDERQYPLIKVNQVGYYCNDTKTARVSYFEKFGSLNGKTYEIVNAANDEAVFSGTLPDGMYEEKFSGEIVHQISFDEVTEAGTYYIRIPDAGLDPDVRSPRDKADGLELDELVSVSFEIKDDVYDDMLSDLTKYYYYQRQGITIEEKYAGDFARENLHPNDITVKKWSDRDNPDAETFDVSGGWYDAGDYGKYTSPGAQSVEDLLRAYELYPDVFADLEMNIPETDPDNPAYVDAPGILAEIKWELDMLLKLEHSSKDGSFYTAANYSDGVIYLEDTLYKTSNHESDPSEIDLRCHLATADMAAVLAHAYIVYKDIPVYADFAEQCLATALRSWDWVNDSANAKNMSIGAANRTYIFKQADLDRSMYWAAGSIYRALTLAGEDAAEYEDYLVAHCNEANITQCFSNSYISYSHGARSFLGYYYYLYENENADAAMTDAFSSYSAWRTRCLKNDNWGLVIPTWGFWWGSNKYVAQSAMTIMLGDMIMYGSDEPTAESVSVIEKHFHYLLGNNPISFSYVSGWGENSVENIYSAIYSKDAKLDPYKCPAGYFTEGANNHNNPHLSKFVGKCYIDSDSEYTTNENTIYGNAAMILLTAAMMNYNQPAEVKGDVNADGMLSLLDVVMLQKWLVCAGDITDMNAGDVCEDEAVNVYDLSVMKHMVING